MFGYSAFSDSTLSSMDTIAHGLGTGTTVAFNYIPGGLTRAANFDESGAAYNYTATDGVVTFSGSTYSELTARVNSLDSTLTTTGATVVFKDADNVAYVFSQGGSDDLLVKLEGTAVGALGLTVSTVGSNSIITATRHDLILRSSPQFQSTLRGAFLSFSHAYANTGSLLYFYLA